MAQIDVKDLDHSPAMRTYFSEVVRLLVECHEVTPAVAREMVDRYFSIEVDPMERALVMHTEAGIVADDLAKLR